MKYSKRVSEEMNKLLEKNYDAEKGYLNASKNVNTEKLKQFFEERAEERSLFAKELRTEILSYGQIPEDSGSLTGSVHRNWMTLKSLFSSNDEEAILEEAIRGEKDSLQEYNKVLDINEFAPSTLQLLEKQRQQIQYSINSLKVREHSMR
jgi:uncharacterized protein (TIGR02284 family)